MKLEKKSVLSKRIKELRKRNCKVIMKDYGKGNDVCRVIKVLFKDNHSIVFTYSRLELNELWKLYCSDMSYHAFVKEKVCEELVYILNIKLNLIRFYKKSKK